MSNKTEKIYKTIEIINEISPSMCTSKWYHAYINLQQGMTKSCCYPEYHTIPLEELRSSVSALHNTQEKKQERKQMLLGQRTKGCEICWDIEDLGDSYISERHIKSSWASQDQLADIVTRPWHADVVPDFVEVMFSNECNFKCGYCHPTFSTSYQSEIKKFGSYSAVKSYAVNTAHLEFSKEQDNEYVQAWWSWWPQIKDQVKTLRITGGEPLLHSSFWKLLDDLEANPMPNLKLEVNSNLGASPRIVNKLIERVNSLLNNNKISYFKLFTSLDTWGSRAEYGRTGLNLDIWMQNMQAYLRETAAPLSITCTFNILSVTSFVEFLKIFLEWRQQYQFQEPTTFHRLNFDVNPLRGPLPYDMLLLPKSYIRYIDTALDYIKANSSETDVCKFSDLDVEKFRRVRDYFANTYYDNKKLEAGRRDFYNWFTEHDRRRGVDFKTTFPEMADFWELCKSAAS